MYEIEIYEDEKFHSVVPVIASKVKKIMKDYGIDEEKYYFAQCLGLEKFITVDYAHIEDEDTTLSLTFIKETAELESIDLSKD